MKILLDRKYITNGDFIKYTTFGPALFLNGNIVDNNALTDQEINMLISMNSIVIIDGNYYIGTEDKKYYNDKYELLDVPDDALIIPAYYAFKQKMLLNLKYGDEPYVKETVGLISLSDMLEYAVVCLEHGESAEVIKNIIDHAFYSNLDSCETLEEVEDAITDFFYYYWGISDDIKSNKDCKALIDYSDETIIKKYADYCLKRGFINETENTIIKNLNYVFEYNGKYYIASSIEEPESYDYTCNMYNGYYLKKTAIYDSVPRKIVYLDEDGTTKEMFLCNETFTCYSISEYGILELQNQFGNIQGEMMSQSFYKGLYDICKRDDKDMYQNVFTLSSGEKIYDGSINDNIYITFGKSEDGKITYQITKDDEVLYQSDPNYTPLCSKVRYKLYLDNMEYNEEDYMDELLTDDNIVGTLRSLMPIVREANLEVEEVEETLISVDPVTKEAKKVPGHRHKQTIGFTPPIIVEIDGTNYYARDIIVFNEKNDNSFYIYYPGGNRTLVLDNYEDEEFYESEDYDLNPPYYFFLDYYLKYVNVPKDENGIVHLTEKQICNIVIADINSENEEIDLSR